MNPSTRVLLQLGATEPLILQGVKWIRILDSTPVAPFPVPTATDEQITNMQYVAAWRFNDAPAELLFAGDVRVAARGEVFERVVVFGGISTTVEYAKDESIYPGPVPTPSGSQFIDRYNVNDAGSHGAIETGAFRSVVTFVRNMSTGAITVRLVGEMLDKATAETSPGALVTIPADAAKVISWGPSIGDTVIRPLPMRANLVFAPVAPATDVVGLCEVWGNR